MNKIIYRPAGRAGEYWQYGATLYEGCAHGCLYCYAPIRRCLRQEFRQNVWAKTDALARFEADCRSLAKKHPGGVLIGMSPMTDPYQPIEAEKQITRRAIELAHEHNHRVKILTKAGELPRRDFDLLGPGDWFGITLAGWRECPDGLTPEWEPNAANPIDRVQSLWQASQQGIATWVSFEPTLDVGLTLSRIRHIRQEAKIPALLCVGKANKQPGVPELNALVDSIDWPGFALDAARLLHSLPGDYYLKTDLAELLPVGTIRARARATRRPHGREEDDDIECRRRNPGDH